MNSSAKILFFVVLAVNIAIISSRHQGKPDGSESPVFSTTVPTAKAVNEGPSETISLKLESMENGNGPTLLKTALNLISGNEQVQRRQGPHGHGHHNCTGTPPTGTPPSGTPPSGTPPSA